MFQKQTLISIHREKNKISADIITPNEYRQVHRS